MPVLVLNAPVSQLGREDTLTFDQIVAAGIGRGYAIPAWIAERCSVGMRVVLLSKDGGRRAEGVLSRHLVPQEKTLTGMQRYDVHVDRFRLVPYRTERLGRTGVSLLEDHTAER